MQFADPVHQLPLLLVKTPIARVKSLQLSGVALQLGGLRAHDPELARSYLYAKILGALILDELCEKALAFFPWGYPILPKTHEPMAPAADPG